MDRDDDDVNQREDDDEEDEEGRVSPKLVCLTSRFYGLVL